MGIGSEIGSAIGNAATGGIPGAIEALAGFANGILDRAIPDPIKRLQVQGEISAAVAANDLERMKLIFSTVEGQLDVNKAEAASSNWFASGWRPSIGWTCSAALAFQFVVAPVGVWASNIIGHPLPAPPMLDQMLWELMFGMLGLGGLRTYEKIKGVA